MLSASEVRSGLGPGAQRRARSAVGLTDADIRAALFASLAADGLLSRDDRRVTDSDNVSAFVVQELPIRGGFVRADVVVVSPSAVHVYEIKSDRDRLDRLPEQVRTYSTVADYLTIVTGWNHAAEVLRVAPRWAEVWLAERTERGSVSFVPLRGRMRNPELQPRGLASLLSRDEALSLLTQMGAAVGFRSKPSGVLHERIAEASLQSVGLERVSALKLLRPRVRDYLFHRDRQVGRASLRCGA